MERGESARLFGPEWERSKDGVTAAGATYGCPHVVTGGLSPRPAHVRRSHPASPRGATSEPRDTVESLIGSRRCYGRYPRLPLQERSDPRCRPLAPYIQAGTDRQPRSRYHHPLAANRSSYAAGHLALPLGHIRCTSPWWTPLHQRAHRREARARKRKHPSGPVEEQHREQVAVNTRPLPGSSRQGGTASASSSLEVGIDQRAGTLSHRSVVDLEPVPGVS